jgi:hypothetical protein
MRASAFKMRNDGQEVSIKKITYLDKESRWRVLFFLSLNTSPCGKFIAASATCTDHGHLNGNGCYAQAGPSFRACGKVISDGGTIDEFCADVRALRRNPSGRHNLDEDLPCDKVTIDWADLHRLSPANQACKGFIINLSAQTLEQVDEHAALDASPVVAVLPIDQIASQKAPAGRKVIVCPTSISGTTSDLCGIFQIAERNSMDGFSCHGTAKLNAEALIFETKELA